MELYTMGPTFLRETVIDEFESAIWTERFSGAGDFKIDLPATSVRISQMAEGKFVGLRGSKETMMIETQSIEDGMMTVVGTTLEEFLNQRWIIISTAVGAKEWKLRDKPGLILGKIVGDLVVVGGAQVTTGGVGGALNVIPNLTLGALDSSGVVVSVTIPFGPMYDALKTIADTYQLGMAVYLVSADAFNYSLQFTTFKGVDRSSNQVVYDPIKFSPALDSMVKVKELRSIAGYKTVAYVVPPDWSASRTPAVEYAPGVTPTNVGFGRRVLVLDASDIAQDEIAGGVTLATLMQQKAKDALANNNFTKVLDGEVVPQPGYIYGTHYNLGDTIELVGQSGIPQLARITEYIRSQDATGERAYPTVSVID